MASITITVPDTRVNDIVNAFGYQSQVDSDGLMIQNPETKAVFMKRKIVEWIKIKTEHYLQDEAKKAVTISEINIT